MVQTIVLSRTFDLDGLQVHSLPFFSHLAVGQSLGLAPWLQRHLLGKGTYGKFGDEMPQQCKFLILGLQLFRDLTPLHHGRILKLQIPNKPLLPSLVRVDNWILILLVLLGQKIAHIFRLNLLLQGIQEHFVVHKAIFIFLSQVSVFLRAFEGAFCSLVEHQAQFIEPLQNCIINSNQSTVGDDGGVSAFLKQILCDFQSIAFDGSYQCSFASGGLQIHVGLILFHEELDQFNVVVGCCSVERSGHVVDEEIFIDKVGLTGQELIYFGNVILLNMPKQVLIGCKAMSNALHCSHEFNFYSIINSMKIQMMMDEYKQE